MLVIHGNFSYPTVHSLILPDPFFRIWLDRIHRDKVSIRMRFKFMSENLYHVSMVPTLVHTTVRGDLYLQPLKTTSKSTHLFLTRMALLFATLYAVCMVSGVSWIL
jgi:uncharacterized membrane protein